MLNIKKIVKLQMCRPETRKNNHAVYDSKRSIFYNSTQNPFIFFLWKWYRICTYM